MCKGQNGAPILIEPFLQGGKGSAVAMRGLFVGNGSKDPRGICFASNLSGQLLWENAAQKITAHKCVHFCAREDPKIYMLTFSNGRYYSLYFQHAHFIPMVGVGKERRTLIGPWSPAKWQHPLLELP